MAVERTLCLLPQVRHQVATSIVRLGGNRKQERKAMATESRHAAAATVGAPGLLRWPLTVEAADDYTVAIHLPKPFAPLLYSLGIQVIPAHILEPVWKAGNFNPFFHSFSSRSGSF